MKNILTLIFALVVSTAAILAQTVYTLGTGTLVNTTSGWPTSYGQYYTGHKVQYLVPASELIALGATAGNISGLAFDVVTPTPATNAGTAPDGTNLRNFTIKMGSTTATAISGFLPVTSQVYAVPQFITTVGWNTHTFATPFFWDGVSNLVFESCYDNYITASNYSTNAIVNQTATTYTSLVHYYSDGGGVCPSTAISGTPYSQRPNMQITISPLAALDAGISAINSPVSPAAPGIYPITATITNYGTNNLTSATISFSINGGPPASIPWNGNLAPLASHGPIVLGNYNFPTGLFTIKVWSSNPNGQPDGFAGNDTTTVSIYFTTPLIGTYTIGGPTADFISIHHAVSTLSTSGVAGHVVFNVTPNSGPYQGGIDFGSIPGASATNTITFNGNGNVINEVSANYMMAFNGSSYITINDFKIINTNPATPKFGIMVRGGSQYLSFTNNFIDMGMASTSTAQACIAVSGSTTSALTTGNNGQYLTITGNELLGGYYSLTLMGMASYQNCFGNTISNNIVRDFYLYGIYLNNVETTIVSGNNIHRANRAGISTFYGVYLGTVRSTKVMNNRIHSTGMGSYSAYPIYVTTSLNTFGLETEFINNLIYNIPTTGTLYAMYFLGTNEYINLYHNTVFINPTGAGAVRAVFFSTAPNLHNMKNNIFSIGGTGTGTKYLVYLSATSTSFYSNNNVLHLGVTSGTNHVGYWTTNRTSFLDWQTNTLQDLSSYSTDPVFANPLGGNLAPLSGTIDNIGTPLGVLTDFYGANRSQTTPDAGAIEFTGVASDIALSGGMLLNSACLSATDTLTLTISNVIGSTIDFSLNPLTVNWIINGPVNSTGSLVVNTGTLAAAASMNLMATTANLSVAGVYALGGYLSANAKNLYPGNDTLMSAFTLEIKAPFEITPAYAVITNTTDSLVLTAKSPYFPGGAFFITEVCHWRGATTGAPVGGWPSYMIADDYIEITGVPNSDLAGHTLEQWSETALLSTQTFGVGTLLSPNGTAIFAVGQMGTSVPSPTNFYYHGNGGYTGTFSSTIGPTGRIIKDPSGTIIDAVGYGPYTFPAASGVTAADWSGTTPFLSSAGNRLEGPYTKTSANWINSGVSPQNPNVLNNLVTIPTSGSLTGLVWTHQGMVIDSNVTEIVVGPFPNTGIYHFMASYPTPCGLITDTATIFVQFVEVYGDTTICAGDTALVGAFLPGMPPFSVVITNGVTTDTISGIPLNMIALPLSPSTTTTYTLLNYWPAGMAPIAVNKSVTITVNPLPVVSLGTLSPVCVNDPPFTLTGGSPSGGIFSGPGVAAGQFDPSLAGAGTHTITYVFTDVNGCTNAAMEDILVKELPNVTLVLVDTTCVNYPAFSLTGGMPVGGTYSGPAVSGGMFDPAAAGLGTHTITYVYLDPASACTGSATFSIVVDECLGLDKYAAGTSLQVFPNPAYTELNIRAEGLLRGMEIILMNLSGQEIFREQVSSNEAGFHRTLDVGSLPPGLYYVRLQSNQSLVVQKVVILK